MLIKLHVFSLAIKIPAPVLKDCCSQFYKILAENSARFLFGALQTCFEQSEIFVQAVKISSTAAMAQVVKATQL